MILLYLLLGLALGWLLRGAKLRRDIRRTIARSAAIRAAPAMVDGEALRRMDQHAEHRKARIWEAQHVRVDALDVRRRRPGSGVGAS